MTHPLVLSIVAFIAVLTFTLKRKYVIVPLVLGMLLVPYGQNLYVGGFHLLMIRLLILFGCIRVGISRLSSSEKLFPGGFNTLDKIFLVWAFSRALATILLYGQVGAAINQVNFLWESVGGYFLFRSLIANEEDILRVVKALVVVALIAVTGMIYEQLKGQNLFAFLGVIHPIPEMREGRVRSQAVFGHALLAGAYGATTFCLFLWQWKRSKTWFLPLIGILASLAMTFAAATSTPLMALMGGIFALCLWPLRDHMRVLRWSSVIALLGLHLVMKAPVWYLLGRIDLSGGSTGEHRARLIDNFIRHFGDWWLIGTHDNATWGWDMWDQCNQYIFEGENGGLIAFVCFVTMICICYRWIGNARKAVEGDKEKEWLFWILGAAFFSQTMAFIGVDYFDQMKHLWYLFLVIVTVTTQFSRATVPLTALAPRQAALERIRRPWERLPANRNISASDAGIPSGERSWPGRQSSSTAKTDSSDLPADARLPKRQGWAPPVADRWAGTRFKK